MSRQTQSARLGWRLAFRLARREMRARPDARGFAGFRIFLLCLTLGIFTIAGVGSLSAALVGGMVAQGQSILGGDIDVRVIQRPASEAQRAFLTQAADFSEVATLRAMIRPLSDTNFDAAMLVEAKAVDGAYPLYGDVRLSRVQGGSHDLAAALAPRQNRGQVIYGAVAEQGLFDRLAIEPGALLAMGDVTLELRAVLAHEPDRNAGGFPLAPRLMVQPEALTQAGLLRPGALVNHHYRLKLPARADTADVKTQVDALQAAFPEAGWRVRDRSDASPAMRRFIERLGLFLTLVGLTALVVGGVGVGNAITAYLQKRRETIAVLKALGGTGRFIARIYALQIAALSFVALGVGLALGAAVPFAVQVLAGDILPVRLALTLYPKPLLAASGFGLLAAAAFALWPLGRVELTSVTALFRGETQPQGGWPAKRYLVAIILCFIGLCALAILISERRDVALWFALGIAISYILLRGAAALLVLLARRAGRPRRPELRMALANITRPNAPVRAVMLSIGLSVTLLSAISMVDGNVNAQISGDLPDRTPSFFLLDIAPEQMTPLMAQMRGDENISQIETTPMLRGQIISLRGIAAADYDAPPEAAWVLRGDRGLTYAADLPDGSSLVAGQWWPQDYQGPVLVSVAAEEAGELGLTLGDEIKVNVLGRPLTATIANLRHIDWASGGMNFVFVFSPQPLASAPHTHLASLVVATEGEAAFTRTLARNYPNISIIRVKEAIASLRDVLTNLGLGIRAMSGLTLLAGILVLAGAMASGHRARVYDAVVMKVLGATRRRILLAFALEYALMGLGAAVIAVFTGTLAAYALVTGPMQADFVFLPLTLALTVLGAVALTVILGLVGTYAALGAPAAPVLRSQ